MTLLRKAWAYSVLQGHWPAGVVGLVVVVVILVVMLLARGDVPEVLVAADVSAHQTQDAKLKGELKVTARAKGGIKIRPGKPRPSTKADCPDCPACPGFDLDWDLMATGGADGIVDSSSSISVTAGAAAGARPTGKRFRLWGGMSVPVSPADFKPTAATLDLQYESWMLSAGWAPGTGEIRAGIKFRFF